MKALPRISEAEWDVMQVVWDRHPSTALDVHRALVPPRDWSPRTVKTLLARLVKKGALGFETEGKRYHYAPRVSREECVRAESRSFMERFFGGSTSPLITHFVQEGELTPDQLTELRALLAEMEADMKKRGK